MYKVSFLIDIPDKENITEDQFIEYLKSELSLETLSDDNPLEFYAFENDVKNLQIIKLDNDIPGICISHGGMGQIPLLIDKLNQEIIIVEDSPKILLPHIKDLQRLVHKPIKEDNTKWYNKSVKHSKRDIYKKR